MTIFGRIFICAILLFIWLNSSGLEAGDFECQNISTFSIVARDSVTGEMGVAVASRFFAVGNVVPWAKAGFGAVATQSFANTTFGWRGLELLEKASALMENNLRERMGSISEEEAMELNRLLDKLRE